MQSLPFHLIRFGLLLAMLFMQPALAGDMTLESLSSRFPPPLHVQPKLSDIPAWPITSELEPEGGPIGYVFESIDLAPIPGFEGTPMNLLVAIDRKGNFIDVAVLRQHEPVFLSGLGEVPLNEFVRQYAGKNLRQDFTVASAYGNAKAGAGDNRVVLDGVTKATASVRIVNQTVLAAGLAVARSKLGFADPGSRGPPAELRRDIAETLDFATLVERGLIGTLRVTHAEAEKLFAGSEGEGVDDEALANPDGTLIELYVGYLNLPTVGRTVLGDARYGDLMQKLEPGQHALWVASTGRDRLLDDSFVPGTAPPKLQLTQGGYPAEMRDLVFEHPAPPGAPEFNSSGVFRVYAASNLDPAQAMQLTLTLTRAKGIMLPRITNKSVSVDYTLPDRYFVYPPKPLPEWLIAWQGRWPDLALIGAALVLLSAVLAKPQWMARDARRLVWFRSAFLLFTLVFIGWYAQGQLSIVQITGAIKTLMAGQNLASFLYDPVSLLIIAFTLVSFFIWGRGTFCGWLCPFGALQEFVAMAARKLRVPQIRLPAKLAHVLDRGRYRDPAGSGRQRRLCPRSGGHAGRGGAVQDGDHGRLRPHLALCGLGGRTAAGGRLQLQVLLPLRVPARRCHGARRQAAPLRLARAARRMRQAMPDLPPSLRIRCHRPQRRNPLRRLLPVSGLRRHSRRRKALRAAIAVCKEGPHGETLPDSRSGAGHKTLTAALRRRREKPAQFQRCAALSSASRASTQRLPSGVSSRFQKGARVFR
jgi:NosR/NirI family nitrous oxide reductase transcriptional regulator